MRNKINSGNLAAVLLLLSPYAWAATGKLQWEMYLAAITVISMVGAILMTRRKSYDATVVKVLVTGVYFWVFTFVQLGVLATLYGLMS